MIYLLDLAILTNYICLTQRHRWVTDLELEPKRRWNEAGRHSSKRITNWILTKKILLCSKHISQSFTARRYKRKLTKER